MDPQYPSLIGTAEADCAVQDCSKDGLNTGLRAADDAKHLTGCGLIFECFLQLPCPRLHFLEQPRVLDGDHGLVRKGIDELDLTFGERAYFGATDEDHANCLARVDQRDGERGAKTKLECKLATL